MKKQKTINKSIISLGDGCDNCYLLLKKLEEREKEIDNLEL